MMKILSNLSKPTPRFCQVLGNVILYGCSSTAVIELTKDNREYGLILVVVSMVGKFITDLQAETRDERINRIKKESEEIKKEIE